MTSDRALTTSPLRLSTLVLVTIAMVDLVSTLVWLNMGHREGNPFFAGLVTHGSLALAAGKLAFLVFPVLAIEWARLRRPLTAEVGTWVAASAYAWLWGSHVWNLVPR